MKHVLITKLCSLGDLIHVLPALSDAKKACPDLYFDWVVDKNLVDIPLWHPAIKNVFITNHRVWRKKLFSSNTYNEFFQFYNELKNKSYDLIIDAHSNIKSGLIACIPEGLRAGFDSSSTPEWGSHFFYNATYKAAKNLHAIEKLRLLFAQSLGYQVPNTPPHYGICKQKLKKPNFDINRPFLIFVPIASHASKLWPESLWKALIEKTLAEDFLIFLPWGNLKEKQRAENLKISDQVVVLPKLCLNEIGYLLDKAKAVVSLDTGLSHIAASLDTPCITLYGPTDPHLTGTIGKNQSWIRSRTPSLEQISSDEVYFALKNFISH